MFTKKQILKINRGIDNLKSLYETCKNSNEPCIKNQTFVRASNFVAAVNLLDDALNYPYLPSSVYSSYERAHSDAQVGFANL